MSQLKTQETCVKRLLREWPLVFVFGCILFALYPLLYTDLGMIDDWAIVDILGRSNEATIFSLIQQEAIEQNGRFRPACMTLWYLEVFFAGDNAGLWHMNRLLLALVSALALYLAIRILLLPLPAGVVTLLFFSGSQNESWIRLGACESYGAALVLIGLAWIVVQLRRHNWHPAQLFPGLALLLLAGFMKESFIPVLPAVLVFIYGIMPWIIPAVISNHRPLRLLDRVVLLFLLMSVGGQIFMTMTMLHTYGHFHSAENSLTSFLDTIKSMIESYAKNTLWFVPVMAGLVRLLPRNPQQWREQGWRVDLIQAVVLLIAGGFLILGPQAVIYSGSSLAGRYLTPGNLFIVFAAALGLYLLSSKLVDQSHAELRGVVIGMLIAVALMRAFGTHKASAAEALATHQFQTKLAEIIQLKTQHPKLPLLFYSTDVSDREPLISVATFLAAKLPDRERPFLNPFHWETGANTPHNRRLAKLITEESLEGDKHFAKISDFRGGDGRCIAVVFSGFTEDYRCEYAVRVRDQ
jgi:hypothetical protein